MPKVFLTGSGPTRGYVTGSGFLNNPVRTMLRDFDNVTGRYPTVHRMNRLGTEGVKPNTQFKDTHTVRYGTSIKDDFELRNPTETQLVQEVDSRKWVVANSDIKVQREIFETEDPEEVTRGVLVLRGKGDSEGRWIRTKDRVSKPTLIFSVIQGPYNTGADNSNSRIKLYQGTATDTLALQVSTTGNAGDWKTIKLKREFVSSNASPDLINSDGKLILQPPNLVMNDLLVSDGTAVASSVTNQTTRRPTLRLKVDLHIFSSAGYNEPFYIRLIQESISNVFLPNWAISDINIISRNQQVKYPFLDVSDTATLYHRGKSIVTPNFINSIVTTGSSVRGVSDTGVLPFDEQANTPFNEDTTFVSDNSSFYTQGVSPSVTPGFNNTLFSKTFFDVSLLVAEQDEIKLGVTETTPVNYGAEYRSSAAENARDNGQMLMAYWNFNLKKWEKIGQPLLDNRGVESTAQDAINRMRDNLTGSCLGFGPIMPLAEVSSAGNDGVLFPPEVMDFYGRPTHIYGFPFAAKYHATSSQTIKASDLGITKPLLLEKVIYDLNIDFEIPSDDPAENATGRFAYNAYFRNTTNNQFQEIQRLKIYQPTFFILTQRPKHRSADEARFDVGVANYLLKVGVDTAPITEELPKSVRLVSGSNDVTTVYDTREMITYGQYQLYVTASATTPGSVDSPNYTLPHDAFVSSSISMDDILSSGLLREAHDVVTVANTNPAPGVDYLVEIRNKKMNVPVKITNKHEDILRLTCWDLNQGNSGDFVYPILDHKMQSREFGFNGASRAIVNGHTSLQSANKSQTWVTNLGNATADISLNKKLQNISPYIVYPEDDLIFGVQYPVSWDLRQGKGGIGTYSSGDKIDEDIAANNMLVKDTKIRLIGSQIKNNSEFHEGLNQNLTSNAIHEVIGSEPVVDQFQISNRTELTGSFLDQYPYRFTLDFRLYGPYIHISDPKVGNFTRDSHIKRSTIPALRVDSRYNSVSSIITEGAANPFFGQIRRFLSAVDLQRTFNDARIVNAPGATVAGARELPQETRVGSYSSLQNFTADGSAVRQGGGPKYYFNYKSFGQYSDLIRQGHDSKFVSPVVSSAELDATGEIATLSSLIQPPTEYESRGFNLPPVRARFVEQQLSENLNLKQFIQIQPADVDGTTYRAFQSSNISPYATSSLPFFDDGNVRNRTYLAIEFVEVTV